MKVKICGLKSNITEVVALQPDYIGLIFWEGSARFVNAPLPNTLFSKIPRVGVFVDADKAEILNRIRTFDLSLLQLHGRETPAYCRELKSLILENIGRDLKIIKAFSVGTTFNFEELEAYQEYSDFFLFDSRGPLPGGNGTQFNWEILNQYPYDTPYFLSGGISETDLEALQSFMQSPAAEHCHALDINSKFELKPGHKDIEKLKRFMQAQLGLEYNN